MLAIGQEKSKYSATKVSKSEIVPLRFIRGNSERAQRADNRLANGPPDLVCEIGTAGINQQLFCSR